MDYVPTRTRCGNQLYLLAALFAHNLTLELQMATTPPCRNTTTNLAALWAFEKLATLRINLLNCSGRFMCPQGILALTLNANSGLVSNCSAS